MPNKSLFLTAAEKTPGAVEKIASLVTKRADLMSIYNRRPTVDPLDNAQLGPERSSDVVHRGQNIGALAGTLGGAAIGGLAGHEFGAQIGHGIQHPLDSGWDLAHGHEPTMTEPSNGLAHLGGEAGALPGAAIGGVAGHAAGKAIGAGIGRLSASRESEAAEKIKRMDPASGLAHIRMLEQNGAESPSVIQAMKDAYNTRRTGLQTQMGAGVALPPGDVARDIGTPMRQRPV